MQIGTKKNHLPHLASFSESPIVFFTVCTHLRRHVLDCDAAHDVLRGIWTRSAERNGWYVGDYVLMPEHVHFFARACSGADRMGRWVSMWKSVSSRALMKREEVSAPVWQSDYFDRYLRSGESYGEKWLYVEQNPVRAGLVTDAEQWPYRGRIHRLGG